MNGSVCVLIFVFCVCLTAVFLFGLFANMLIHERLQAYREGYNAGSRDAREGTSWDCYMAHKIRISKRNTVLNFSGKVPYILKKWTTGENLALI